MEIGAEEFSGEEGSFVSVKITEALDYDLVGTSVL